MKNLQELTKEVFTSDPFVEVAKKEILFTHLSSINTFFYSFFRTTANTLEFKKHISDEKLNNWLKSYGKLKTDIFDKQSSDDEELNGEAILNDLLQGYTSIILSYNEKIKSLSFLSLFPNLQYLDLMCCSGVSDLSALINCPELRYLNLVYCTGISDLSALANCPGLRYLNLACCTGISDLSPLVNNYYPDLEVLRLTVCEKIKDLSFLFQCPNLKHLDLLGCSKIENFSPISECYCLENLTVPISVWYIEDFSFLFKLKKLKKLRMGDNVIEGSERISAFIKSIAEEKEQTCGYNR